jgi:hypothetical protein
MENIQTESSSVIKKSVPAITAGILSISFAILSVIFMDAANAILAVVVGIFGLIKCNRIGKILSILGIIVGIVIFIFFNPFKPSVKFSTADGTVYTNSEYNFRITPPIGWKINSQLKSGIVAFVEADAPIEEHPVIVVTTYPGGNLGLDEFVTKSINETGGSPNYSLIKNEKITANNNNYYIIETSDYNDSDSVHTLTLIRGPINGNFFIVVGMSSKEAWDKYAPVIRDTLLSFTN